MTIHETVEIMERCENEFERIVSELGDKVNDELATALVNYYYPETDEEEEMYRTAKYAQHVLEVAQLNLKKVMEGKNNE